MAREEEVCTQELEGDFFAAAPCCSSLVIYAGQDERSTPRTRDVLRLQEQLMCEYRLSVARGKESCRSCPWTRRSARQ